MNYNKRLKKNIDNRKEILNSENWWQGWKSLGFSDYTINILTNNFQDLNILMSNHKYPDVQRIELQNIGDIKEINILNLLVHNSNAYNNGEYSKLHFKTYKDNWTSEKIIKDLSKSL